MVSIAGISLAQTQSFCNYNVQKVSKPSPQNKPPRTNTRIGWMNRAERVKEGFYVSALKGERVKSS